PAPALAPPTHRSRPAFSVPVLPPRPDPPRPPPPPHHHHATTIPPPTPPHHANGFTAPPPPPTPTPAHPSAAVQPFRAPAHRHAHHLHSIPPREKSTRTLIIDHLLWAHARTRFAQARAELAMTDRTAAVPAARERPETLDEEDEARSDGEDAAALLARAGGPGHPHDEEEDARIARQDLRRARALRLRAEGLEKVVTGMLDQPPMDHPFPADEPVLRAPASPAVRPALAAAAPVVPVSPHPHTLPNGVRLRLALATVVNDLFARQAPVPRHLHTVKASGGGPPRASRSSSSAASTADTPNEYAHAHPGSPGAHLGLPSGLLPLATISSGAPTLPTSVGSPYPVRPPRHRRTPSASSPSSPHAPPPTHSPPTPRTHVQYTSYPPPVPSARTRDMFLAGADPTTANSPPSLRCPRHLHTGCEICVEAKEKYSARPRGATLERERGGRVPVPQGGGLTGFVEGSGVGAGLSHPGPRGTMLRRRVSEHTDAHSSASAAPRLGAGNTRLAELITRFMRLSALVALELGREAGLDASDAEGDGPVPKERGALRPAREWYLLLAGLLTRAVLEGYLSASWRGLAPVQTLLGVGLGLADRAVGAGALGDPWAEFDPDEMPDLKEAAGVLFPALREVRSREEWGQGGDGSARVVREGAEAEYEREMMNRLARFFDVPPGTPDLSTHMEDLAWQYPAEPVERAAVRFCEAVAKWRGKPELETYKKRPPG
ncbi:hypothetical protein DENSPDRAFT_741158, partial [Dentipellis sp. KUC8613]